MRPPSIRITSPAHLLEIIPYLLGFHPSDSLVALGLAGQPPAVVVTARIDLPTSCDLDRAGPGHPPAGSAAPLVRGLAGAGAESAVLVAYGHRRMIDPADTAGREDPAGQPFAVAVDALQAAGIEVLDALVVRSGRYRSVWCGDRDCCPPRGKPIPEPDRPTHVSAWAVRAGLVAADSRDDLLARVAPLDDPAGLTAVLDALAGRAPDRGTRVSAGSVGRAVATVAAGGVPDADQVAGVLVELSDPVLRDAVLSAVTAPGASRDGLAALRTCLTEVVRRAPPAHRALAAAALATCCYVDGDGAMADVAARTSLADKPSCELARLVLELLAAGIPPAALDGRQSSPVDRDGVRLCPPSEWTTMREAGTTEEDS